MCIDYQKLNKATKKDHFPLPFIDDMLVRLANHTYFCFLDGYLLMVYFGTPNMFITLWFGFVYGTNPPLGTLII
jgi:hypothetical protein